MLVTLLLIKCFDNIIGASFSKPIVINFGFAYIIEFLFIYFIIHFKGFAKKANGRYDI